QTTAFVANDDRVRTRKEYSLDELVGEKSKFKFKLVEWDGESPTSVTDTSKRIIALLAGHPIAEKWPLLHQQAANAIEERRSRCFVLKTKRKHRRGRFIALQCGVLHGGGQKRPSNKTNHSHNAQVLRELNDLEYFKRVVGFASG
ncbi:hypothetical protein BDN70DRAFT_782321, partial [Pholiota conissans]